MYITKMPDIPAFLRIFAILNYTLYYMASSNFVDYVKLNLRSGKGGAGSAHLDRSGLILVVGLMAVMEAEVGILFLKGMPSFGHCCT